MFLWLEKIAKSFQCQFVFWGQRLILLMSMEEDSTIQISLKYPSCSNLYSFIHYVATLKSTDFSNSSCIDTKGCIGVRLTHYFASNIYLFITFIFNNSIWCILFTIYASFHPLKNGVNERNGIHHESKWSTALHLNLTLSNNCALLISYTKVTVFDLAVLFSKM